MTEAAASAATISARVGPGRLVLVVGPSGAGKDTLIDAARALCGEVSSIVFLRRTVTRAASAAEDNIQVSPDQFRTLQADDGFALHWEAHGHAYGLARSLHDDLRAGRTVVANVSRTVIAAARKAYDNVLVVLITAPADILAARIAARARSSDGSIQERVGRSVDAAADVVINNVGAVADHAQELARIIRHGRQD